MKRSFFLTAALAVALLLPGAPGAEIEGPAATSPLELGELLRSTERTHPRAESAARRVEAADGDAFSALGAWDPNLELRGEVAPVGYYDRRFVDATVRQNTPVLGAELFAGYRIAGGRIPVYKGELETLSGGELRAGVELPLLRDRAIDGRRARIRKTELSASGVRCEQQITHLELNLGAATAYWNWVAAGLQAGVSRELLRVAEERDVGLREQAAQGSIPPIVVTDNEQLVLDRRGKWIDARRKFQEASVALSLYLRDRRNQPVLVARDRLPSAIPVIDVGTLPSDEAAVAEALTQRPELCALANARASAEVDLELAENARLPSLQLEGFISRDLGDGADALEPTELGVGLRLEVPLLFRQARGQERSAQARIGVRDAHIRGTRDRVTAEIRAARIAFEAAAAQVEVATSRVRAATRLAEGEREKFEQGLSDLVTVNLRELAVAEAAALEVAALAAHQIAHAEYLTAIGRNLIEETGR